MMKSGIPSVSFPLLLCTGLTCAAFLLVSCDRSTAYYAVVEGPLEMEAGDPVLIDGVAAGNIRMVEADSLQNRWILELALPSEYSIPSNSEIGIYSGASGQHGSILISIVASKEYYHGGDTIFRGAASAGADLPGQAAKGPNISGSSPVYKVQVFASGSRLQADEGPFEGLDDLQVIEEDGMFKYYTGSFDSHEDAEAYRKKIIGAGIGDAFIVCFLGGERISVQEALQYEK